jgi:hypothetical protein
MTCVSVYLAGIILLYKIINKKNVNQYLLHPFIDKYDFFLFTITKYKDLPINGKKKKTILLNAFFNDLRLKLNNTCFIILDFDMFTCLKSFFLLSRPWLELVFFLVLNFCDVAQSGDSP